MKEKAIENFKTGGLAGLQRFLSAQSTKEALGIYDEVLRHLYWQEHDLTSCVLVAKAGLELGKHLPDDEAAQCYAELKTISYNLASFTWPGWNEAWLPEIPDEYIQLGYEAAKSNLFYAKELQKGDLILSRGYWMLAAHDTAQGNYLQAAQGFEQAQEHARAAGEEADAWLSAGFIQIVRLLQEPESSTARTDLEAAKNALQKLEHGEFFVKQLEEALRVFS